MSYIRESKIRTLHSALGEISGNVDIYSILVVDDTANVAHRRVNEKLLLFTELPPLLRISVRERTRVAKYLNALHVEITNSRYVHFRTESVIGATHVTVESDGAITFALRRTNLFARSEILEAVGEQVRMRVAEDKRAELHDRDEPRQVENLGVWVTTIEDAGKVEELSTLVDLGPEALL